MAGVAGLAFGRLVLAIDRLGEDPRAGCLAYAAGTAEQERMGEMARLNGVLERGGNMFLPHNGVEGLGAVFAGGDDEFFHKTRVQDREERAAGFTQRAQKDSPFALSAPFA